MDVDLDNDVTADLFEVALGSSASNPDTDGDSMPDGYEYYESCLDPLTPDSGEDPDGDLADSLTEYLVGDAE